MEIELTVLGNRSPYPMTGKPCPGYLLEVGGAKLLLDCGPGVFAALLDRVDPLSLGAAWISHWHPDHASDTGVLAHYIEHPPTQSSEKKLPLYAPGSDMGLAADAASKKAFDLHWLSDGETFTTGGWTARTLQTQHRVDCLALRLERAGFSLVYTGDAAYSPELVDFCRGASVLLAEATLPPEAADLAASIGHLTWRQVAQLAHEAQAGHLLLTHFHPLQDRGELLAGVKAAWPGDTGPQDDQVQVTQCGERYSWRV